MIHQILTVTILTSAKARFSPEKLKYRKLTTP